MDLRLPFAFALLGFLFTTRTWLLFMNNLNPAQGLFVYYCILTVIILILQWLGLTIAGIKYNTFLHTLGTILIMFAFFIIVDWESCYVNITTKGHCDEKDLSSIYLQSEDGAIYWLWSQVLPLSSIETLRILTYVATPFILAFIGSLLITSKISLSVF